MDNELVNETDRPRPLTAEKPFPRSETARCTFVGQTQTTYRSIVASVAKSRIM